MNKKVISLVLALVMVLGTFTSVFAAEKTEEPAKKDNKVEETKKEAPKAGEKVEKVVGKDNKIQYIVDKKFVKGYEDGSMGYDKNITRAEITRLLVLANGNEELANSLQGAMKLYTDVDTKHWANGVISVGTTRPSDANKIAMLAGYPDKSFKPDKNVTYAELAKMLVVLVKKDLTEDMVKNAKWATSWLLWAKELGILEDIDLKDSNAFATRADAFTMMYNALYKMVEFKRVPANAIEGVLSSLKNGKLVLNQDEKEQTYTIADGKTVFVGAFTGQLSNTVLVKDLTNPEYYLGSFVRIVVNDKKEVTHIVELGNPKNMALGLEPQYAGRNYRWEGVAKKTVSTGLTAVNSLRDITKDTVFNGYATLQLDNKIDVDSITFHGLKNKDLSTLTLRVNDDTKVYVANPYNNIMKKVTDINAALALLGNRDYDGYKIPNVYAGYESASAKSAVKSLSEFNEGYAKVIVFNAVTKRDGGTLYRVLETTDTRGQILLENTDGKLFDRDMNAYEGAFPFNHGGKFDIVKFDGPFFNQYNINRDKVVLKASDTDEYPIAEILDIDTDSKTLVLRAEDSEFTVRVSYANADVFSAKRFDKLEKGAIIQIKKGGKAEVSIISILDKRYVGVKGSLRRVFGNEALSRFLIVGTIRSIDGKYVNIEVRNNAQYSDSFIGTKQYSVANEATAQALRPYLDKVDAVKFYATENLRGRFASEFRENTKEEKRITEAVDALKAVLTDIDTLVRKEVKCDNYAKLREEVTAIKKRIGMLSILEQDTFKVGKTYEAYATALADFEAKIKAFEDAKTELDAQKLLVTNDAIKDVSNANLDPAKVLEAAKAAITAKLDAAKAEVESIELVNTPGDNKNFAKGAELKVKVVLRHAVKKCLKTEAFELTGNVAN